MTKVEKLRDIYMKYCMLGEELELFIDEMNTISIDLNPKDDPKRLNTNDVHRLDKISVCLKLVLKVMKKILARHQLHQLKTLSKDYYLDVKRKGR